MREPLRDATLGVLERMQGYIRNWGDGHLPSRRMIRDWAASLRDGLEQSTLPEDAKRLEAERDSARAANERDRSTVAEAVSAARRVIKSYGWATESRGPYSYDDDEYMAEFGRCLTAIESALALLDGVIKDLSDCPQTQAEVVAARAGEPLRRHPKRAKCCVKELEAEAREREMQERHGGAMSNARAVYSAYEARRDNDNIPGALQAIGAVVGHILTHLEGVETRLSAMESVEPAEWLPVLESRVTALESRLANLTDQQEDA